VNLTRTRAPRTLIVGATLGMTIGLGLSGLTAMAAANPEPPISEQVADTGRSTTEPVQPQPSELVTEPIPPATEAPAEPAPPATEAPAEPAPPATEAPAEPAPPATEAPAEPAPPATEAPAEPAPPATEAPAEPAPPATEAPAEPAPTVSTEVPATPDTVAQPDNSQQPTTDTPSHSPGPASVTTEPSQPIVTLPAPDSDDTGQPTISPLSIIGNPLLILEGWCSGSTFMISLGSPSYDSQIEIEGFGWLDLFAGEATYLVPKDVNADGIIFIEQWWNNGWGWVLEEWIVTVDACKPSAPAVTATVGSTSGSVRLTWAAPNNGGARISDYTIQRSTNGSEWTTLNDGVRATTGYTATGLTGGRRYYFRVQAENEAGNGPWSKVANAVARTAPSAVRSLTATSGNRSVALRWAAPTSNGGSAVTRYVLQRSTSPTSGWVNVSASIPATARSFTNTGLRNGTRYYFRMAAVNAVGRGSWSSVTSGVPR
jgi:fibronectin type III domain protein